MADILRPGAVEIAIPKTEQPFVASEKIMVNTWDSGQPKIAEIGAMFLVLFSQKVEEPKPEMVLRAHTLLRDSTDVEIIDGLGGEPLAESSLSSFYFCLNQQRLGTSGHLIVRNGETNLFYARDCNGVLQTISASWENPGWFIDAHEVDKPSRWLRNLRVFSRRSAFKYTIPAEVLKDSAGNPVSPPVPVQAE